MRKAYGATLALDGVSLAVARGELVSLLGPSGCGKTTLLRIVAGFLEPDAGEIAVAGRKVRGVPPAGRNLGMVFQAYSLWPHMSVAENVGFGLACRGIRGEPHRRRVEACLDLVRLGGYGARLPRELSGGQQQRVALARALAYEPDLLLLDEPLSALDRQLREDLQAELRRMQRELGVTTVLVTHDQNEALALSTRIAVMAAGRIEQLGSPEEIYRSPATPFVARFVGRATILAGTVEPDPSRFRGRGLEIVLGREVGWSGPADLVLRPHHVSLATPGSATLDGAVIDREYHGGASLITVALDGGEQLLAQSDDEALREGTRVGIEIDTRSACLLSHQEPAASPICGPASPNRRQS